MDELIDKIMEAIVQAYVTQFQDLFNRVPHEFDFAFLVAMKVTLEALLPGLSEEDRELYDFMVRNSETLVMPRAMDPRNEETNHGED